MDKITHFILPENTNQLYKNEARSSISLTKDAAEKINELVDAYNEFSKKDLTWKQDQDGRIRGAILYMKDNLQNTLDDMMQSLEKNGFVENRIKANMERFTSEVHALTVRLDNLLGSISEGGTTADAELIDIRTGSNGERYTNAGEGIRNQIERLDREISEITEEIALKPVGYYKGTRIDITSGTLVKTGESTDTYEVHVVPGGTYYISQMAGGRDGVALYDASGKFVSLLTPLLSQMNTYFTIPANVSIVRYAVPKTAVNPGYIIPKDKADVFLSGYRRVLSDTVALNQIMYDELTNSFISQFGYSNRLNPNTVTKGWYVSDELGTLLPNENYNVSDFVQIEEGETLCLFDENMNVIDIRTMAAYDKNKNRVEGYQYTSSYTQSGDAKYIRFTIPASYSKVMIAHARATKFIEYGAGGIINAESLPSVIVENQSSMMGTEAVRSNHDFVTGTSKQTITAFPYHLKKSVCISFYGKFATFSGLLIGKGLNAYRGAWIEITNTSVICHRYEQSASVLGTVDHNLTMSDFIGVNLELGKDGVLKVNIITKSGVFDTTFDVNHEWYYEPFYQANMYMTDVSFNAIAKDFKSPLWMFGDSYLGYATDRVLSYLDDLEYTNYLIDSLPGQNSTGAYSDLVKCLQHGTPKFLVWCLGMNDDTATFRSNINLVKQLCDSKNITLFATKIPSVPNLDKTEINRIIDSLGIRYIDWEKAVTNGGSWYSGFLSSDNVHPTELGAKALSMRMIMDVPELMQY